DTVRAEYNIPHDAIVLGSVGRFVKNKGFDTCLRIFAKVQKKHPQSKSIMYGYGEEEASYRRIIRHLGIEESVIICARTDVEEVMAAIDVFLFTPYGGEGFGLVIIEAMSSGKPVIASNVQPIPDIVLDSVTGFLPFPERVTTYMEKVCIEPFVEKIQYLIENPAAREKMGIEGRKRVEEKYSTDMVMRQIERLYEMLSHQYPPVSVQK
ncbi:MAG: glycosyltransferase family 4 protein, partial [Planctomycetes bacterium]|nr:glycosyltransferase family 4 protein [Planctomycetota bacterium]